MAPNQKAVDALLDQSIILADYLKVAFDTPSGVPDNHLLFDPKPRIKGSWENGLAVTGTLILEWQRLSDLTGDKQYGMLAAKAQSYLLDPKPAKFEPWPGLLGSGVYIDNGTFIDARGGWGGGFDSFYEYLIKMYVYDPARFELYKDRWVLAADSTIKHLASHPTTDPDLTFLSMYEGQDNFFYFGHCKLPIRDCRVPIVFFSLISRQWRASAAATSFLVALYSRNSVSSTLVLR